MHFLPNGVSGVEGEENASMLAALTSNNFITKRSLINGMCVAYELSSNSFPILFAYTFIILATGFENM